MEPKYFWTPCFFGSLFYRNQKILRTKILLGPKLLGHKIFGTQNFWDTKFFGNSTFLRLKKFWDPTFFGTQNFLSNSNLTWNSTERTRTAQIWSWLCFPMSQQEQQSTSNFKLQKGLTGLHSGRMNGWVSGMGLQGTSRVSERCLEGIWMVTGRCLEGMWKVSRRCLETYLTYPYRPH